MHLKKLLAVALAAVLMLSLFACGKKDEYQPTDDAAEEIAQNLINGEAGRLTIYAEADMQIVYDKDGDILDIIALSTIAEEIVNAYDFAEKDTSLAVKELIDSIVDLEIVISKGYVMIRQEPGSATPNDTFLKDIHEEAKQNKAELSIVLLSAEELDANGYFSAEIAVDILTAQVPTVEGSVFNCSDEPIGGSYQIFCTDSANITTEYAVGAIDGSIVLMENSNQEEEPQEGTNIDETPDSDVFDPISDHEANAGTDGATDNGSI